MQVRALQHHSTMTDDDQEYLQRLYTAIEQSAIAKKTVTTVQNTFKRQNIGPLGLLNALRKSVPPEILTAMPQETDEQDAVKRKPKQIILAQYLAPKVDIV